MYTHLLQNLSSTSGELLEADRTVEPEIEVRQQDDIRWMHFGDNAIQSAFSLLQADQLLLPYTQSMLLALLFMPQPESLLNLGLGGGSFNRFFSVKLPRLAIDSVEQDPRIVDIARRWFMLDASHEFYITTAQDYLRDYDRSYDLIFCDLHDGNVIPDMMFDSGFYENCAKRTTERGVVAFNLMLSSEQDLLWVMKNVRLNFDTVALLEVPNYKNIILFAFNSPEPDKDVLDSRLHAMEQRWKLDLKTYVNTLRIIPKISHGKQ